MLFQKFSQHLSKIESISSRLEMTSLLAELLRELSIEEIDRAIYLITGRLAPEYKGIEFQLAEKMVLKIIAKASGEELEKVQKKYRELGDIGRTAEQLVVGCENCELGIDDVYKRLVTIAKESGEGSQERKIEGLATLLTELDSLSIRYVARIPTGNLRLGFSEKTLVDALSVMEIGTKEKGKAITRAFEVVPDFGTLAKKIKSEGIERATKNIAPIIGIPVMPALCSRIKSPKDMIKKMGEVIVEPKFDGLRVLIHYSKKKNILKAFTRNLKDISSMFPELKKAHTYIDADDFILDSEAVGMDPELLQIADFQTTMHRRRKHGILESLKNIPLTFQVFDILYLDGLSLMDTPYLKRRNILEEKIKKDNPLLKIDEYTITNDPELITKKHKEYRGNGLEGIIVKKKDGAYVPGRTGWNWVKMKEDEDAIGKLPDTIDGVIMGYTSGRGKRVDFGVGQFLVGVRNGDTFVTVTKVGTGLTDTQFKELAKRLKPIAISQKPDTYAVHNDLTPDFWVSPEIVVELAGDDLTVSPKHTAGYALRFPRLVKFRDDKTAKQGTTVEEVKKLFKMQKS